MTAQVLVTGATGYLGGLVARRYLTRTYLTVLCPVRAADRDDLERRRAGLAALLGPEAVDRLVTIGYDLGSASPFGEVDPGPIVQIVHGEANTRFSVDAATADAVNVRGTAAVVELAERCPRLESVGLLSTLYVSGLASGPVEEAPARPAAFANEYERSKWEAERDVLDSHPGLPFRVLRTATMVADDDLGTVTQLNVVHQTLRLLFYGLLSLVPGEPGTPVHLTTGAFAADGIFRLMRPEVPPGVFNLVHDTSQAPTLEQVLDTAFAVFGTCDDFRRKRVLRPLFADRDTFALLVDAAASLEASALHRAMASMAPFARQLYVTKQVHNDSFAKWFPEYHDTDIVSVLERACRYVIATRWGRRAATAER